MKPVLLLCDSNILMKPDYTCQKLRYYAVDTVRKIRYTKV